MCAFNHARESYVQSVAYYVIVGQLSALVNNLLRRFCGLLRMLHFDQGFNLANG